MCHTTVKKEVSKPQTMPSSQKANNITNGVELTQEICKQNLSKLAMKFNCQKKKDKTKSPKPLKEGKKPRIWDLGGSAKDLGDLDRTKDKPTEELSFNPDTAVSSYKFSIANHTAYHL